MDRNEGSASVAGEEPNSPRSNLLLALKNMKKNEEIASSQDESAPPNAGNTQSSPRSNLLLKIKNLKDSDQLPPTPIQSLRKSSSSSLQIKDIMEPSTVKNKEDVVIPMEPISVKEASDVKATDTATDTAAGGEQVIKKRNPWKSALGKTTDDDNSDSKGIDNENNTSDGPLASPVTEEKKTKEKNNQFLNLIRGVGLVAGKLRRKRNQQRLNFEKYITYLQSIKAETGFSVLRSVMTWGGVSNFVFIVFSAVAVFAQEAIFGDATTRNVNTCLNKTVIFLQNL